jgi:hypothetical protein
LSVVLSPSAGKDGTMTAQAPQEATRLPRRIHVLFAWSGIGVVVLLFIACIPLMRWLPTPVEPTDTGDKAIAFYSNNQTSFRCGLVIMMLASPGFVTWGAAIAAQTRRIEHRLAPVLTYAQLAFIPALLVNTVIFIFVAGAASYRPEALSPGTMLWINDLLWIIFDFMVAPLSFWAVCIGLAILVDQRPEPAYPRWVAWLNFWAASLMLTGEFLLFFRTGPMAYDALFGVYWPLFVFAVWILVMSAMTARAVNRDWATGRRPLRDDGREPVLRDVPAPIDIRH